MDSHPLKLKVNVVSIHSGNSHSMHSQYILNDIYVGE